MRRMTLRKGTVIHVGGAPAALIEDTVVTTSGPNVRLIQADIESGNVKVQRDDEAADEKDSDR